MIKKVYISNKKTITKKVEKDVPRIIKETYTKQVPHSRSKWNGPSSSGKCLRCGVTLVNSMWVYQDKSNKFLCKRCWYSISMKEREEFYQRATHGYFSSETYYTTETLTREKTIYEKKLVDEEITINEEKIVNPINIEYKTGNKIYWNKLDINYIVPRTFTFFSNEEIKNDENWYGVDTLDFIWKRLHYNRKKDSKIKMFSLNEIPYNEEIISEEQKLIEFCDVVGFYPNVPAYIQGYPLNMYNNIRRNEVTVSKNVNICVNLSIDSKFDFMIYENRGIIIINLFDFLREQDIKVSFHLIDASFIDGETIIQELVLPYDYIVENYDFAYNLLTSICFYRIVMAEHKRNFIRKNNLSIEWDNGLGYCLPNNKLRDILNLKNKDILIGNPEEHGINGLYRDDDYANCMSSLGLYKNDDEEILNIKHLEGDIPIKDTIINRGIDCLIHVTSEKNIESIKNKGILSVDKLEKEKIDFQRNDYQRLDKHTDAICLSVTTPNCYLINEYIKRNPNEKYYVIEIDPIILLNKKVNILFYDYNAASRFSSSSNKDMEIMFREKIRRRSTIKFRKNKNNNMPTSNQAEILYFGEVAPKYIKRYYEYKTEDWKD